VTFRRRLALLTASAVALTVILSSLAVYAVVRHQLLGQLNGELRRVAAVHSAGGGQGSGLARRGGPTSVAFRPPNLPRLISESGRIVAARFPEVSFPVTAAAKDVAAGRRSSALESLHAGSEHLQVLTVPAGSGRAFQVAQSLASVDGTLHRLFVTLLIVAVAGILLAPLAGQAVAGGALRPVRRLTRTAGEIARTGDIDYRIEVDGRDELASLGASFNAMLDRIAGMIDTVERAQRAQRQLVADASHELRTPLTSLRGNVELLALGPGAPVGDRDELVRDTLGQLEGLATLVTQLIELAREDMREPERIPVRLDVVVEEVLARARQNYSAIHFEAELEPTTVLGAHESLGRAVANLLDNAAKWSSLGDTVHVRLRGGTLEVRDHGPGIDAGDLPHVFERFYRGTRARDRPGSGLGLAIVAQVVSSHGGDVRVERAVGGGALLAATFPLDS
jgi:two-component system, OmpR family, sensor histidine kinase MprB